MLLPYRVGDTVDVVETAEGEVRVLLQFGKDYVVVKIPPRGFISARMFKSISEADSFLYSDESDEFEDEESEVSSEDSSEV